MGLPDHSPRLTPSILDDPKVLEGLLDDLPIPVFVKDERHAWVLLNDACCAFMGRRREELLGRTDHDFFLRDEADVFWRYDDLVFRTGATTENEERFTDASGQLHVIVTRKTLHVDASGRRLLLGVISDVTARKQAEEALSLARDDLDRRVAESTAELRETNRRLTVDIARRQEAERDLRESEERFRLLADTLPEIVWTTSPAGPAEFLSECWFIYTGQTFREAIGWGWQAAVHADDLPALHEAWARALTTGDPLEVEYRVRRHDGAYRWHLCRGLPVPDCSGEIVRWVGTTTDIEDQKREQEALREDDRRKDEFLALLGHELRNPLTPIRTAVALLRRRDLEGPVAGRALEILDRQIAQMTRLIDDLLDVSRISRGKVLLRKEPVELAELLRAALRDRAGSLEARALHVETSFPEREVVLDADPARLSQAIGNLLDNAEKFSDPGGLLRVSVAVDEASGEATVAVRDTGIGMSKEMLARVFQPFSQAAPCAARGRGGLGLGLWLVRGLVELHGGRVTATSEGEGRGAEITLTLPLSTVDAAVVHPAPPVVEHARPCRVLVIEDNGDAAETLQLALTLAGHAVIVAETGEEGIARALACAPDVVLCDIGLPGAADGYAVARALRSEPSCSHAHLVAITGYGQAEDRRRALEAGFDRHLTKPFDLGVLERILCDACRQRP